MNSDIERRGLEADYADLQEQFGELMDQKTELLDELEWVERHLRAAEGERKMLLTQKRSQINKRLTRVQELIEGNRRDTITIAKLLQK